METTETTIEAKMSGNVIASLKELLSTYRTVYGLEAYKDARINVWMRDYVNGMDFDGSTDYECVSVPLSNLVDVDSFALLLTKGNSLVVIPWSSVSSFYVH